MPGQGGPRHGEVQGRARMASVGCVGESAVVGWTCMVLVAIVAGCSGRGLNTPLLGLYVPRQCPDIYLSQGVTIG